MRITALGWLFAGMVITEAAMAEPMVEGRDIPKFGPVFGLAPKERPAGFTAECIATTAPANILWPEEQATFTIQLVNRLDRPIVCKGKVDIIAYGTKGTPEDIWTPDLFKVADVGSLPIEVDLPPRGFQNITLSPTIPERFGGYALIVDLGPDGREFAVSCARSLKVDHPRTQFPKFCMDGPPRLSVAALQRLGVQAVRLERGYLPTTEAGFKEWFDNEKKTLRELHEAKITVLYMVGATASTQAKPLHRPRPHLDDTGLMLDTKADWSWTPDYDEDFQAFCYLFAKEMGYPKGPITAFSLFNEPWEGLSISGWGADMLRYRTLYRRMAAGVIQAREKDNVQVLIGGCDSTANALDKLFCDGSDEFLPIFDFSSIHYQGLFSGACITPWAKRNGPSGRVRIWDTESWVANTDDRVAGTMAAFQAAGYDRAMGVNAGNVGSSQFPHQAYLLHLPGGKTDRVFTPGNAWPVAPAVAAANRWIGNREFRNLLFPHGLPWIFVFDGQDQNEADGTVVITGDLRPLFGHDAVPFRTAMTGEQTSRLIRLQAQQKTAGGNDNALRRQIQSLQNETFAGSAATVAFSDGQGRFVVYDSYGNAVSSRNGRYTLPLDGTNFFVRTNGAAGAFAALLKQLQQADITGISPVLMTARDLTCSLNQRSLLRLTLKNLLNKRIQGALQVSLGRLKLDASAAPIVLEPHETKELALAVPEGVDDPENTYLLAATFQTTPAGDAGALYETLHVNTIAARTIAIDGDLQDWTGVPGHPVQAVGTTAPSMTEQAWLPFAAFTSELRNGLAQAYLAYDADYFYFAARIADDSPDHGTIRQATRDDDSYFYPEHCYTLDQAGKRVSLTWPAGVRRFSYRKDPDLPFGSAPHFDNVQIGFNVLAPDQKPWTARLPGVMPELTDSRDTDYEFALNSVSPTAGGGTEIVRLLSPGMPFKHFYPRQPKSPQETPVQGRLAMLRRDNLRIVEAAIPWNELPAVHACMKAGTPIKFTFRVNDNTGRSTMELPAGRSVAKLNCWSLHPAWVPHWSNEIEFGWQQPDARTGR